MENVCILRITYLLFKKRNKIEEDRSCKTFNLYKEAVARSYKAPASASVRRLQVMPEVLQGVSQLRRHRGKRIGPKKASKSSKLWLKTY